MKRPRCSTCESAMKTPYHRTGKAAKFVGVDRWWYCDNCNQMQIGPQLPSENPDDYLHPDAASVYPRVSPFVRENFDRTGYLYVNELKELGNKYDDDLRDLSNEVSMLIYSPKIGKSHLLPYWYCSRCDETKQITEDLEDDKLPEMKHTCGTHMKITIKPHQTETETSEIQLEIDLQKAIDNSEYKEAGKLLLELILEQLSTPFRLFFRPNFNAYRKWSRKIPQLKATWGYQTINCLEEAFLPAETILEGRRSSELRTTPLDYGIQKFTKDLLSEIFADIALYLNTNTPQSLPRYRYYFIKIMKLIDIHQDKMQTIQLWSEKKKEMKAVPPKI